MYESKLPEKIRTEQLLPWLEQFFGPNDQRRELQVGFGALRRVELTSLAEHHEIELPKGDEYRTADAIAGLLEGLWIQGKFGRQSSFDNLSFHELQQRCKAAKLNCLSLSMRDMKDLLVASEAKAGALLESGNKAGQEVAA